MDEKDLIWKVLDSEKKLHTPVLDVIYQNERAESGLCGTYVAMDAPDWIVTIPVLGDSFIMVRQWRHALQAITTEFPGGVGNPGEEPEKAAARELLEETGYRPGRMTHLATCSPNPALFSNKVHFYLAEDLTDTGVLHPDEDEFLHSFRVPIAEVLEKFGTGEYLHAFLGTAIALYLRHTQKD